MNIPDWANYLERNRIGDWYAYEFRPTQNDITEGLMAGDGDKSELIFENKGNIYDAGSPLLIKLDRLDYAAK